MTLPPQFLLELSASSRYQGIGVTLRRRLTKELTYLVATRVARRMTTPAISMSKPMNPANTRLDWSRSRQY